jgi:hypothetical protein
MVAHGGECLPIKPTRGDTFAKPAVHLIDSTFEEVLESYKRRGYIEQ